MSASMSWSLNAFEPRSYSSRVLPIQRSSAPTAPAGAGIDGTWGAAESTPLWRRFREGPVMSRGTPPQRARAARRVSAQRQASEEGTAMAEQVAERDSVVRQGGEGEALWFLGGLYEIRVSSDDSAGAVSIVEFTLPENAGPPPHVHDCDEILYVLE